MSEKFILLAEVPEHIDKLNDRITEMEAENADLRQERDSAIRELGEWSRRAGYAEQERDALRAQVERLRVLAESVPGPVNYGVVEWGDGFRREYWRCACGAWESSKSGIPHQPDCLYVKAQAALRGEEGKP